MTRSSVRLVLLAFALAFAGCEGCDRSGPAADAPPRVVAIGALDTLGGGDYDGVVSVGGVVVDEDERDLVLQDASGLVRVRLREAPPALDGLRLLVQGRLRRTDDGLRLEADEWLYDSTRTEP